MDINFDVKKLNIDTFLDFPLYIQAVVWAVIFIVVLIAGYILLISPQFIKIDDSKAKETDLKNQLIIWHQKLLQLNEYEQQVKILSIRFANTINQLPKNTEIPGLLDDITKMGVANGLDFKLFKPLKEVKEAYYAEIPIEITVIGTYHEFARFVSELMNLGRVLTVQDFSIRFVQTDPRLQQSPKLTMEMVVRAYRRL